MMIYEHREDKFYDLAILNKIEANPDISQAMLADELKISIGTVNGRLKNLIAKGDIEVKQGRRRKLRYIITTAGRTRQRLLTEDYIQQSFKLFRQVRQQVKDLLKGLNDADAHAVRLLGKGDIVDVCRLTCLENDVRLTEESDAPALVVDGLEIRLVWP